ncbi:MAG: DNA polymerase III subunit delta [Alphaproteobacteria bacterium]
MKVQAGQADRFVRKPDAAVRAILVYGPDAGLVRERADAAVVSAAESLSDPFRVAELTGDALKRDPARLSDEAAAIAFTGGRRAIRLREPAESLASLIAAFLESPAGDGLVVVEAGDLGPASALRKLFEGAGNAAAVACYTDDARSLEQVAVETLGRDGITATPDALSFLVDHLGTDRALSRAELEKLVLYVGPGGRVDAETAAAIVGDTSALSLDTLIYAAGDGDLEMLDRALERCLQDGAVPVSILRAIGGHLLRLQAARARVDRGETTEQAMKSLRPPVFFKWTGRFQAQLRSWSLPALAKAIETVLEAERRCKTTGIPEHAVCGMALLQIAGLGRAGAARRSA